MTINAVNIISLLCTSAYTHRLPCGFQPAAQLPEQRTSMFIRIIHAGCGFPPEVNNLEQGPNIPNTPFRRARRSPPVLAAAGCRCPCPTWLRQRSPQPSRAILRQPAFAVLLLLLQYPPDLALQVPFGFIKAYLTQTVGKHFREKLSLSKIDNVFVPV